MSYKLLIINPGSTSTKIGVYEDEKEVFVETLRHSSEEIAKYNSIFDQKSFRKEVIMNILRENNFDVTTLDAIVGQAAQRQLATAAAAAARRRLAARGAHRAHRLHRARPAP